jgi:hypothetical protein
MTPTKIRQRFEHMMVVAESLVLEVLQAGVLAKPHFP